MIQKLINVTLVVVLAICLALMVRVYKTSGSNSINISGERYITVIGIETRMVKPDSARVSASLVFESKDMSKIQGMIDQKMSKLYISLKAYGVGDEDYFSSKTDITKKHSYSSYRYDDLPIPPPPPPPPEIDATKGKKGKKTSDDVATPPPLPELLEIPAPTPLQVLQEAPSSKNHNDSETYKVTVDIEFLLHDLSKIMDIQRIDKKEFNVTSVRYLLSDNSPIISEVNKKAMDKAKTRAEEIASELGGDLGQVISVEDSGVSISSLLLDAADKWSGSSIMSLNNFAPPQPSVLSLSLEDTKNNKQELKQEIFPLNNVSISKRVTIKFRLI
jgi:uncharacterized protein YggE